jgi:hypothetical protein
MEGRSRRRRRTVSSSTVNNDTTNDDIGLRNVLMMRGRETTGDERKRQEN